MKQFVSALILALASSSLVECACPGGSFESSNGNCYKQLVGLTQLEAQTACDADKGEVWVEGTAEAEELALATDLFQCGNDGYWTSARPGFKFTDDSFATDPFECLAYTPCQSDFTAQPCDDNLSVMCRVTAAASPALIKADWSLSNCRYGDLGASDHYLTLDGRKGSFPNSGNCQAFYKQTLGSSAYTLEVSIYNLLGNQNDNVGHAGFAFNVVDDNNYDFIFMRPHNVIHGRARLIGGKITYDDWRQVPFPTRTWNEMKMEVDANNNAKLSVNGAEVLNYTPNFPLNASGGVTVLNGFNNVALFRDFSIKLNP